MHNDTTRMQEPFRSGSALRVRPLKSTFLGEPRPMSKNMPYLFAALSSAALSVGIAAGEPPAPSYTQIDYPAATATGAYGTNARGDVVGFYVDPVTHQRRGF